MRPKAPTAFATACVGVLLATTAAGAQPSQPVTTEPIAFDIPAQPLGAALNAYGVATGLDIYFDGALVQGHYSHVVRGSFTPSAALRMLLDGTGLVVDETRSDDVTILQGIKTAPMHVPATQHYEPYFAIVQAGIGKLFCRDPETWPGSGSVVIRLWIGVDGTIVRSEATALGGDQTRSHTFAAELQNVRLDAAPPAGMPQPVTMAILPRRLGEVGCTPANLAGGVR
jgi:hypothetical protein